MNDNKTNWEGKITIIIAAAYWVLINIILETLNSLSLWTGWFYPDFTDETVVEKGSNQSKTSRNRDKI